jgi:DNA-binding transcriptional regulator YiaG
MLRESTKQSRKRVEIPEDALRRVLEAGESEQQVSQDLNIDSEDLSRRVRRERAVRLVLSGNSQTKVAKMLGISQKTLSRWVNAAKRSQDRRGTSEGGIRPSELRLACTTFGAVMHKLRLERATQENARLGTDEFARRLGVSGSTLRNLESAQRQPPQTTLAYPLSVECGLFLSYARKLWMRG